MRNRAVTAWTTIAMAMFLLLGCASSPQIKYAAPARKCNTTSSSPREICFTRGEYANIRKAQIRRKAKIKELKLKVAKTKKKEGIRCKGAVRDCTIQLEKTTKQRDALLKRKRLSWLPPAVIGAAAGLIAGVGGAIILFVSLK